MNQDEEDRKALRLVVATAAMTGLLAGNAIYKGNTNNRDDLAKDAVAHADALLAELEKEPVK